MQMLSDRVLEILREQLTYVEGPWGFRESHGGGLSGCRVYIHEETLESEYEEEKEQE